ncbi:MAG: enoyl-CoA hydratase/isomerase family protein [Actinomycetota bacterium]
MSYETVTVTTEGRVATLTMDNPPVNVITRELLIDLLKATEELAADDSTTVLVLASANPEFFIAHFDVAALLSTDRTAPTEPPDDLNVFDQLCERFRTMSKVTICKIAGRVGGGGSEIAMACDMRYGALGRAIVNQMEVPIGILPGGGGTQRLPRLIGWGRACEIILGGVDLDAETGERWGYFDRALPPDELDGFVDDLAHRIGSFPPGAVRHAKTAMLEGAPDPTHGLLRESFRFNQLMATDAATAGMQRFLDLGGQTPEGERRVDELSAQAARDIDS